jgi:hypothetical protein
MLLLLPFAAFLLFFQIFRRKGLEWRAAMLAAAVFWGASLTVITELLSLPRLLSPIPLVISWLLIFTVSFLYFRLCISNSASPPRFQLVNTTNNDRGTTLLLSGVVTIVLLVGITAVVAPPNTADALEYHLPRVMMWVSNHSVRFYPTPDYSQLIFAPWAEYAMLHYYLLWGGDRLVNLVEFFSFVGTLLGVSLIAEKLGAGRFGQILAVVVCTTIPEGVLEASGSMNTYVVSFWITTTVFFLLDLNERPSWLNTLCVGLAAGLACLTKGLAYVFLPLLVLACWGGCSPAVRMLVLRRSAIFVLLILVLNGPQYIRCNQLTGSPLGQPFPEGVPRLHLTVEHVTFRGTMTNVVRNLSVHFCTPSEAITSRVEKAFRFVIQTFGGNPDDPQTTWLGDPFQMTHFSANETLAGNPLHAILLFCALALFLCRALKIGSPTAVWYALGLLGSFLFFCATLRWHVWMSRLQLPLFTSGAALIGLMLERHVSRKAALSIGCFLVLPGLVFASLNRTRSLIPWSRVTNVYSSRSLMYFNELGQEQAPPYLAAANVVLRDDCGSIAIDTFADDPQIRHNPRSFDIYPLMGLLHPDGRVRSVWYAGVGNLTQRYSRETIHPSPCAVICVDCARVQAQKAEYRELGGAVYVFGQIVVFTAEGTPRAITYPDHIINNLSSRQREPLTR